MIEQYEIPSETLLSSATVSQPFDKRESLDNLSTAVRDPAGLGVITDASPGVEIVRDGSRIPVQAKQALIPGDRVLVPKDGFANAVFPGRLPDEAPLTGTFTGGTDAVVGVKAAPLGGGEQLQVDLASGDLIVAGAEDTAKATTLAVKKAGSAGSEGGIGWLLPFALGGLVGALASRGGDDGDGNTNPPPPPPPPPTPEPTPAPTPAPTPEPAGAGLLDPTATVVDNLTDALDNSALGSSGLGSALQPVDDLISTVTDTGNGLLAPLLGDNFTTNSPNMLDPLDNLVAQVVEPVGGLLGGVLDPLLGQGAASTLTQPLTTQVDFLTDGLNNLASGGLGGAGGGGLGGLLGGLPGGLPGGDTGGDAAGGLGGGLGGLSGLLGGGLPGLGGGLPSLGGVGVASDAPVASEPLPLSSLAQTGGGLLQPVLGGLLGNSLL